MFFLLDNGVVSSIDKMDEYLFLKIFLKKPKQQLINRKALVDGKHS